MAKQMVNPIERHVEKLVVGVAALILVGAVALYLVSSPNKVEMGGDTVTPKTVDAAVAEKAADILARLRSYEPEDIVTPEPLADDFAASLSPLEPAKLALAAPVSPPVPLIDAPITQGGKVNLVKVVRPEKVGVTSGRSTVRSRDESGETRLRPTNWATVAAIFDYKQQVELQKRTYGAKWDQITVVSPEIQRRAQRPDGSWSDEDWQDVKPTPDWGGLPPLPNIELEERRDGTLVASNTSMTEYGNFMRPFGDSRYLPDLLRPLMYEVVNGDAWRFPELATYQDILKQDADYLNIDGTSPSTDRYGLGGTAAPGGAAAPAKDPTDAELDEIRAMIDQANANLDQQLAVAAYNKAHDLTTSTTASASQKQRAQQLKNQANLADQDIRRKKAIGDTRPKPEGEQAAAARQLQPIQQVWAHDAAEGSLLDGYTYQYRVRSRILNVLATDPSKFEDPQDATKVVLVSEWSEPTEPITFEPSSLFYVTYEDRSKKVVGFEFFQWYFGVWLKSRRANLSVGERIQTTHREPAPAIDNPDVVENPEVTWKADGMIVDVDFARNMLERKTTRGSDGVSFGAPKAETAMVYMDSQGRLHERFVPLDKDHPEKKEASGRIWVAKK